MSLLQAVQSGIASQWQAIDFEKTRNILSEHRHKIATAVFSTGVYAVHQLLAPAAARTFETYPSMNLGLQISLPLFAGLAGWWYASTKIPFLTIYESVLLHEVNQEIEAGELSSETWGKIYHYTNENAEFGKRLTKYLTTPEGQNCTFEQYQFYKELIVYSLGGTTASSIAVVKSYKAVANLLSLFHLKTDPVTKLKNKLPYEETFFSFEDCCQIIFFANLADDMFQNEKYFAINLKSRCEEVRRNLATIKMGIENVPAGTIMIPNKERFIAFKNLMGFKGDIEKGLSEYASIKCGQNIGGFNRAYPVNNQLMLDDALSEPLQYLTHDMYEVELSALFDPNFSYVIRQLYGEKDNYTEVVDEFSTCINVIINRLISQNCDKNNLVFAVLVIDEAIKETNIRLCKKYESSIFDLTNHYLGACWDGSYTHRNIIRSPFASMTSQPITRETLDGLRGIMKCQAQFGSLEGYLSF